MRKAYKIIVSGKVQKVFFRKFTKKKAEEYNIKGFVENLPDKTVYIEAEGEESDFSKFLEFCRSGPMLSQVKKIDLEQIKFQDFQEFIIKR